MKLRITQKVIFSLRVWYGTNPEEKFYFDGNDFLGQTCEMGQIFLKTV